MQNSKIEWTHHTFNPWRGCTKVSEGCKHCYAETMSGRNPVVLGVWGPRGSRVIAAESYWRQPLKWNADAVQAGERRRVFCASLADVFEGDATMPAEARPAVAPARERLWTLIEQTPMLDWLLLTKRPENIIAMIPVPWRFHGGEPRNIWYGTSAENQATADERIPHLRRVPAWARFLSCEPLLGPISFRPRAEDVTDMLRLMDNGDASRPAMLDGIHWVIAGGESGPGARPMHPDWARSLRDQARAADVAFFYKQHGEWTNPRASGLSMPNLSTPIHQFDDGIPVFRYGKRAADRLLDGREWNDFPDVATPT